MNPSPIVFDSQGKHPNTYNRTKGTDVVAIVVTHNRKDLLIECIDAIFDQTAPCDIIVLDNASTDGTEDIFRNSDFWGVRWIRVHYLRLEENTGGAGGFYHGLKYAMAQDWEWFWLMDDDAKPEPDALENLLSKVNDHRTIYGSVAVGLENGTKRLCWPVKTTDGKQGKLIEYYDLLHDLNDVVGIPFLGFCIHRLLVQEVGLPDLNYYIYCDDMEYCERAKKQGADITLIKSSVIRHPQAWNEVIFRLGKIEFVYRSLPPWKIYYHSRNKILLGKKYFGNKVWLQTIPGILLRMILSVFREKERRRILHAYARGIIDGFSNISGKKDLFH